MKKRRTENNNNDDQGSQKKVVCDMLFNLCNLIWLYIYIQSDWQYMILIFQKS